MNDPFRPDESSAFLAKSLMTTRIIWFALLMGQFIFLLIVVKQILPHRQQPVQSQPILIWVNLLMFMTTVPLTFFIRRQIFTRSRNQDGGIPPAVFTTGNIIFWAGCEAVSFFGLVIPVITGSLSPTVFIAGMAMLLQVITFPMGGQMSLPGSRDV